MYINLNKLLLVFFFAILTGCSADDDIANDNSFLPEEYKQRIIAHRGVWNVSGSCENSITAISLAESLGIWGSEFDIHETRDGVWVLNHDKAINGQIIRDNDYEAIAQNILRNGESIPRLEDVITESKNSTSGQYMIEVKSGNVTDLLPLIAEFPRNRFCIISFSNEICEELLKSGIHPVYLLLDYVDNFPIDYYIDNGYDGVSVAYQQLLSYPQYIQLFHDSGLKVAAWTTNSQNTTKALFEHGVDYVVTDCAEQLNFSSTYIH